MLVNSYLSVYTGIIVLLSSDIWTVIFFFISDRSFFCDKKILLVGALVTAVTVVYQVAC